MGRGDEICLAHEIRQPEFIARATSLTGEVLRLGCGSAGPTSQFQFTTIREMAFLSWDVHVKMPGFLLMDATNHSGRQHTLMDAARLTPACFSLLSSITALAALPKHARPRR